MRLVKQTLIMLGAIGCVVVQASTPPVAAPVAPAPAQAPKPAETPAPVVPAVAPQAAPVVPVTAAPAAAPTAPAAANPVSAPAAATLPAAPQLAQGPATPSAQAKDEDEKLEGIDTVDVDEPQGNWLYKRIWWQRAQTQYEKTKAAMDVLMEARIVYFDKRTEWDKTVFDAFYVEVGVGRGVLEELINNTIAEIGQDQKKDGSLSADERDLLSKVEAEKSSLEQLQKDVQIINQLDAAIDEVIIVLSKQVNAARGFEKQSWQNLKNIGQELSDEKAKELYYGMITFGQNISALTEYIQSPLLKYFDDLGAKAKDQIKKVQTALAGLKEKGLDFKKRWQALEEKSEQDREHASADKARTSQKELDEKAERAKREQAQEEPSLFNRIIGSVTSALKTGWDYLVSGAQWLWRVTFGRFFGSAPVESATIAVQPAAPVAPAVVAAQPAAVVPPAPTAAPVAVPKPVVPAAPVVPPVITPAPTSVVPAATLPGGSAK